MKKLAHPAPNRQILEEASDWFVEFRVGDVDAAARALFDEWVRRSPEHIRAYWEIAKTYVELPAASAKDTVNVEDLIAYARSDARDNVVPLRVSPDTNTSSPPRTELVRAETSERGGRSPPTLRSGHAFFAVASIAFALVTAGAVYWQMHRYPLHTTDIGERRSITLADGSTVDLNAHSKLRIEFSNTERRVELLEGQALFQVAKDKHRAFLVQSGDALVRAVGTQFDVSHKDSDTTVTVIEGRVAVYSRASAAGSAKPASAAAGSSAAPSNSTPSPRGAAQSANSGLVRPAPSFPPSSASDATNAELSDASGAAAVFLAAGEQVTVTAYAVAPPRRVNIATAIAWIQRKLIFEGSKLSEVASEFNHYNRRQLVIDDPQLNDFLISGVYSSTDPASLIRFLRDQGLRVTERDNEVRIQQSPPP